MKNIAILGTGRHGSRYAGHIVRDIEGMELAGIWRRSEEGKNQARQWSTTYYPDWREMIASSGVDAVVGIVPPALNPAIAAACARAGKPLLLEKPLARNVVEARAIVASLAAAGVPLTVGQTLRYNPVIGELQRQLPELGPLHSFAVNQRLEPSTLDWHDDRETAGSGVLFHTAVHVFDALRLITGLKVRWVMAHGRLVHAAVLEDLVLIVAELEDGVIGTVDVSKVGRARTGRYEFICQDGQLHGEQIHAAVEVIRGNVVQTRREFIQTPTVLHLLRDWLTFLEGNGVNPVTGEEGLYAVQVCEACLVSMREGRWVEVQ
ncbi:MAG: Gfo/Idh/MocA family oxidoreductase [Desulfoprunum sp.]|uniref:Gfo/Idh/MocA family protein n=1 Tax=Desulfoprunum sp. TaxID=2020866 RepID=UPI003C741BE7